MRVFANTNFLVSAFSTRGLSTDVFQLVLAEHQLITGEFVLTELKRVLSVKLKVPAHIVMEAEQLLRQYYIEPKPNQPSEIMLRDEDDRWGLESALRAKAEVLITGDKGLLDVSAQVSQLRIITPREFWELVQK